MYLIIDNIMYKIKERNTLELQEVSISNRRSVKKFKHDMVVDDQTVYDAIYKATDAPNHGMREPWRLVHISKDKLGDFSRDIKICFSR